MRRALVVCQTVINKSGIPVYRLHQGYIHAIGWFYHTLFYIEDRLKRSLGVKGDSSLTRIWIEPGFLPCIYTHVPFLHQCFNVFYAGLSVQGKQQGLRSVYKRKRRSISNHLHSLPTWKNNDQ